MNRRTSVTLGQEARHVMQWCTRNKAILSFALLVATLGWLLAVSAHAQGGGGYELVRSTTASSQLSMIGGGFTLDATAGQAEAHRWVDSSYLLVGGFWGGGPRAMYRIWFPTIDLYITVNPRTNRAE